MPAVVAPTGSAAGAAATPRFQEKREAILAAAALLFNSRGVRAATLADIAASVGLATNSVTYYYRKKEDLASACLLRAIAADTALVAAAAAENTVAARVQAYLQHTARLLADIDQQRHPPLVSFNDIRALPPALAADVFAAYTQMFRSLRSLLRGPETAALSRDDLNARCHIVLTVGLWMRTWISGVDIDVYPRAAAGVADVLLHGLRAPQRPWPPALATCGAAHWPLAPEGGKASDAFLRAATVLVNEQGYRGASVDRISARLHVTKGAFYHHHDTKLDLITACFERSFAVMRQALQRAETVDGSGLARACAASQALLHYQLSADGPLLRATATSALPDADQRALVRQTLQRLTSRMGQLVVDGMVDGSVRPLDPAVAAQGLIAGINAAAELHRWLPAARPGNVDALYLRPLFDGVLCPGA